MPRRYYINLNYICNERCVFCASDLTNNFRFPGHRPWVTLSDVQHWIGDRLPGPKDKVLLAGGEPTLHKELFPIVRFLSQECSNVTLFTNGLRFVDPAFAFEAIAAGITRFEIALFGSTPERHDAITRLEGSFSRTLVALRTLGELRGYGNIYIEVRLLVSKQTYLENPAIVRLLHEEGLLIDGVSINRLILSHKAEAVDAAVAWSDARRSVNVTAERIREYGYELIYRSLPLCVFSGHNAAFIFKDMLDQADRIQSGEEPAGWETHYLDPVASAGHATKSKSLTNRAFPEPCRNCIYRVYCARVEHWYLDHFGSSALQSISAQDTLPWLTDQP